MKHNTPFRLLTYLIAAGWAVAALPVDAAQLESQRLMTNASPTTLAGYTGDSLHYLTLKDTVMLEIAADKSKYTNHVFAPRQTVYSLSRFYAQDIDQVYALNPELAKRPPAVGEVVKVAVPNAAITRFRTADFKRWQHTRVCYRVQPGETLYHIAKTVFRMPVDTLMALNGLKSNALATGQVLQVGWMSLDGASRTVKPKELNPLKKVNVLNSAEFAKQGGTSRELKRGVASWTPGTGDASGQLFALYAGATPGTILKVSNLSNGAYAYVRVIGTPPDNVRAERIDILLSGTAARVLGANERNFYVTIE